MRCRMCFVVRSAYHTRHYTQRAISILILALVILTTPGCQSMKLTDTATQSLRMQPTQTATYNVLLLHSYHQSMPWANDTTQGVQETLDEAPYPIQLHIEYMDTKRIVDAEHYTNLLRLYQHKFKKTDFDIIITADDDALRFLLEHREALFPGVPIVFCGVNRFTEDLLVGQTDVTGVLETTKHLETLNLALALQPEAQRIFIVNDRTTTGLILRGQVEAELDKLARPVQVTFLDDLEINELEARLRSLSSDAIVYLMTFHQDKAGNDFTSQEIVRRISQASGAPIYATGREYLHGGILGGYLNWGYTQGETAAHLAVQILGGQAADTLPIIRQSPYPPMFDYSQVLKWNLAKSNFPANTIFVNKPESLFEKYKVLVISVALAFVTLVTIITLLTLNIYQRQQAEQALRESEEKYRLLVENQTDLVIKLDPKGRFQFVSPSYCALFGAQEDDLLGEPFMKQKITFADMRQALQRAPHTHYQEKRVMTQHGWHWLGWASQAILDEEGSITAIVGVGREITERKQAEEEIQRQNRELALLNHVIITAASTLDTTEVLQVLCRELSRAFALPHVAATLINYKAQEAIVVAEHLAHSKHSSALGMKLQLREGTTLSEVTNLKLPMLIDNPKIEGYTDPQHEAMRIIDNMSLLLVPVVVRGRVISTVGLGASPQRTFAEEELTLAQNAAAAAGQAIEVAELTHALKRQNEELEQIVNHRTAELRAAMEQAQAANKVKSQFVSNVSHELRTPLTNITLYLSLIQRGQKEKRDYYIDILRREAKRLQHLIEDLLNISRMDLGKVQVATRPTNLNQLIQTLAQDRQRLFAERGLQLNVETHPTLSPVPADPKLLEQVITNLLTNALNYTPKGGQVHISTAQAQENGQAWVTISIRDNGLGISPSEQARLFQRFYRGKASEATNVPGTGLGLAISKGIVDLHGGRLTVESEVGQGSKFTVWLPHAVKENGKQRENFRQDSQD